MALTAAEEKELAELKAQLAAIEGAPSEERTPPKPEPEGFFQRLGRSLGPFQPQGPNLVETMSKGNVPASAVYPAADARSEGALNPPDLRELAAQGVAAAPVIATGGASLPLQMAAGGGGNLLAKIVRGEEPLPDAGTALAMGGPVVGKGIELAAPVLSKLRPFFAVGGPKDQAMVGRAVERAVPPLAGARTVEDLQNTMRGNQGMEALQTSREGRLDALTGRMPTEAQRPGLREAAMAKAPADLPESYPITRERFRTTRDELERLRQHGYPGGKPAETPEATMARENLGKLGSQLEKELAATDPRLLAEYKALQQEFSGGMALRDLFEETPMLSPERVFTPSGQRLRMHELQQRIIKMQGDLESRMGPEKAKAFITDLFRGGAPPRADYPIPALNMSWLGGIRVPTGLHYLAGPPTTTGKTLSDLIRTGGAVAAPSLADALKR